jgi:hypothetical protein
MKRFRVFLRFSLEVSYNKTASDFFSYAADRPTDYLFDYNYLGRSESTGLYSQQFILAEGGFKSKIKHLMQINGLAV